MSDSVAPMGNTDPLVEITRVDVPEADGTAIQGRSLGHPQPGDPGPAYAGTYTFEVLGWVVGVELPAVQVTLALDGTPLWEVPVAEERPAVAGMFPGAPGAEQPGFFLAASALPLPSEFELRLNVVLRGESGTRRAPLATIAGRRVPLRTGIEPRFNPLMVTGFSRTGSNAFLRLLGEHPEVIAYRPFRFESRITHYWMDVLRELAEPAGYRRQMRSGGVSSRGWWIGDRAPVPWVHHEAAVEREMGGKALADIAALSQRRIESVCEQLAAELERPHAVFLAEKQLPGHAPTMLWDLYPGAREVFLVRDFRDMMASIIAANRKWAGPPRFGRAQAASDEEHVRRFRRFVADIVGSWRRRGDRAHLVRYEDLIREPRETVSALAAYLEVDGSAATLDRMVDSLARRDEESDVYRTAGTAEASIGRWREELTPAVRDACEDVFAPALELFGYGSGD